MRAGDLARITVPVPSLFESIGCEPTKVLRCGDLVVLLKHEPTKWYWPCWEVLYNDQVGVIASRWLASIPDSNRGSYLEHDEDCYERERNNDHSGSEGEER